MKNTILFLPLLLATFAFQQQVQAQLTVNNSLTPSQLAQSLVANNSVTVSNASMTCAPGAGGAFSCSNCHFGLSAGVVLTTGQDSLIAGPNNNPEAGFINNTAGDADLGSGSHDACALEFDVLVTGNTIELSYVFGSEEYPAYVCSPFNDKFVALISGPGLSGKKIMNLVPGSSPSLVVSIGTVNPGTPGAGYSQAGCSSFSYANYYVDNGTGASAPQNTDATYIQYNGHTTVLTAKQGGLQAGQTYHLKVVIGDVNDYERESGIFLGAGSLFSSNTTGINGVDALSNISLYPNPTVGYVTIDMSNNDDEITRNYGAIEIYNVIGEKQKAFARTGNSKLANLNVRELPQGMYIATLLGADGERRVLGKFTKE